MPAIGLAETAGAQSADSIYYNARVYTVNPAQPWAEAVAIRDGRIVAVGDKDDVLEYRGADTDAVDLAGAMVMPGLNDAHVHPLMGGIKRLYECNFPFSATPDDIAQKITQCVQANPDATWIRGGQWDSGLFDRFQVESPRAFLDAVSGEKAVLINDDSHHNAWVNSRALALAGIDASTPDPADGTIVRDPETGEPNGLMLEGAAQMMYDHLPEWSAAQMEAAAAESLRVAHRFGITGMKSASASEATMAAYHTLDTRDELSVHMALAIATPYGAREVPLDYAGIERLSEQYHAPHIGTRFVKIFMDGVPTASRTAAMLHPYTPQKAGESPNSGMLHLSPERLTADLIELDRRGFTVKIHTAGDRSVRVALDAIAAARKANGDSGLRHELAHAGYIDDADLPRFAQLNAVADLSPYLWHPSTIIDSVVGAVGSPRGDHYWPVKDLLAAGAPVLAGSDWPAAVETIDPWLGIEALVTRRDPRGNVPGAFWPEQAISLEQAVELFTLRGAAALGLERETGSIEPGKSADLVVLKDNLFEMGPDEISEAKILRTVFEGSTVYSQ